eukprot:3646204-Prymnesium_polylepis.1
MAAHERGQDGVRAPACSDVAPGCRLGSSRGDGWSSSSSSSRMPGTAAAAAAAAEGARAIR